MDWAALKLMLKFLQRFMRYAVAGMKGSEASQSPSGGDSSSLSNSQTSSFSTVKSHQKAQPRLSCADIAVVPHKHKNALAIAHARVLLAVCELINYSPAVASYVLTMPGARAIMKASCLLHKDSEDMKTSVIQCMHVLQKESERVYLEVSAKRHSESYERTHGRASKLFNPSVVMARTAKPKSPERPLTSGQRAISPQRLGSPMKQQTQPVIPLNPFTSEFMVPGEELEPSVGSGSQVDILVLTHGEVGETIEEEEEHLDQYGRPQCSYSSSASFDSFAADVRRPARAMSDGNILLEGDREDDDDADWLKPNATYRPAFKPLLDKNDRQNQKLNNQRRQAPTSVQQDSYDRSNSGGGGGGGGGSGTQPPRSPQAYNPPESPPRRGLKCNQSEFKQ